MGDAEAEKQIFILSGQSNMAGRGGVSHGQWDGVVPPDCQASPSILRFTAASQWEVAHVPLHADIDTTKTCGVGPGMPFARAVLASGPMAIGIVPCAVGGTAIGEWEPGRHLYNEMVRRARESVEQGGGGQIKAVLWYQGESDTLNQHVAHAYKARLDNLIHHLRADLASPCLPFIQVALASGNKPYIDIVREAQMGTKLPNVVCVDAMGLPLNEDHLHLSTEAQVCLGKMLADAYLSNFTSPSLSS